MKEIKFVLSLMTARVWAVLLALAVLLLIAGAGAGGFLGHRIATGQAEIAALKVERERAVERFGHSIALARETKKVTALEKARLKDVADVGVRHQQEMNDAQEKIAALRADVRSGALRLSIAVKARTQAGSDAAGGNPAPAGGAVEETRAELMPEAAEALIGIAADGDDAVRDFNACHDAYEAIRLRELK